VRPGGPDIGVSLKPKNVAMGYQQMLKEPRFVVFVLASAVAAGGLFPVSTARPSYSSLTDNGGLSVDAARAIG
jgi:hypothetical protein